MGEHYYYLFTVWKEPEHELLFERKTCKACKEYFGIGDGWYYFYKKIECGREPGYSLLKEKSTDIAKKNRPLKGEDMNGQTKHMIWGEDGDVYVVDESGEVKLLCGACRYWKRNEYRDRNGKLFGYCDKQRIETERCDWCRMAKEGKHEVLQSVR